MHVVIRTGDHEVRRTTSIGADILTLLPDGACAATPVPSAAGTPQAIVRLPTRRERDREVMAAIADKGIRGGPARAAHVKSCKCKICLWKLSEYAADPVNVYATGRMVRHVITTAQTIPLDGAYAGEVLKACHAWRKHYSAVASCAPIPDVMRTQLSVLASAYATAAQVLYGRMWEYALLNT